MTNRQRFAQKQIPLYLRSRAFRLSDVYADYSSKKAHAFNYCVELMHKYNGFDLKIVSYNTFMFTAGFLYHDKNGDLMYMHITPSYDTSVYYVF